MYIRFVVHQKHYESERRTGLFHATGYLKDEGKLSQYEEDHINEVKEWFNKYLNRPTSFSKAKRSNPSKRALSWYKDKAQEHINKMWEMVAILEDHGINVEVLKTDNPGYIVYEDEFQVVAEPFKETDT